MKLNEFRKIIDELDDNATKDYEVVLDIEPSANREYLVDIGEIYQSKMHSDQVKIEPVVELDTHKEPKRMDLKVDMIGRTTSLKCPNCGRSVWAHDRFCKRCGQPLYTRDETHEYLVEKARERIALEKEYRREKRRQRKERKLARKQNKELND